jgi:hypothetical protein
MLELKTKQKLASEAHTMAAGFELVRYRNITYIPADYETRDISTPPPPERTIWLPLSRDQLRRVAHTQFRTLFANDSELSNFDFMVAQNATFYDEVASSLLVRTAAGLKMLDEEGQLQDTTGKFVPNFLAPMLNEDQAEKERVLGVISAWLDSEEEAESLLSHLATCLSPGWSAVKYVLLLGEGRNGKSLLLKMLESLFGKANVSNVTRQNISEQSPVVLDLNGKLLNVVYDGQAVYLKDSGAEKTLIAGEPFGIRRLYESTATLVQTSALFVEGLQKEPKSNDKSSALQKRLVRFMFPNVYALDHKFEKSMLKEESLGAFLSLLIDRYVKEDEVAQRLAPTQKAIELQLEHMYVNSLALQFLKWHEETDALGIQSLLGEEVSHLVKAFQSWRLKENDLGTWAEPDVVALFTPLINTERRSVRVDGKPRKIRVFTSLKDESTAFLNTMKGSDDEAILDALVDD